MYGLPSDRQVVLRPAPTLARESDRRVMIDAVRRGDLAIVYFQNKLGGEISLASTERSPELSFDATLVELREQDGTLGLGRYAIFEAQTMDFHGSYRNVVKNLSDALRLHGDHFHTAVAEHPGWLSERIEGPNIANVFKRTFYQIALKFQVGADETCAGTVLALPAAVWDSWQRHLGRPDLVENPDGTWALHVVDSPAMTTAWIYVFDIDSQAPLAPNPIRVARVIATDAEALIHYALKVAPEAAVAGAGASDRVLVSVRQRLARWWPELVRS